MSAHRSRTKETAWTGSSRSFAYRLLMPTGRNVSTTSRLGFIVDIDTQITESSRLVQLTPPG